MRVQNHDLVPKFHIECFVHFDPSLDFATYLFIFLLISTFSLLNDNIFVSDCLWVHFISTISVLSISSFQFNLQTVTVDVVDRSPNLYIRKPLIAARERIVGAALLFSFRLVAGDSRETCFRGAIFHLFWLWFYFWRRSARNISWTRVNFGGVSKRMRRYLLICSRLPEAATCLLKIEGIFWFVDLKENFHSKQIKFFSQTARTAPWPSSGNYLVAARKKYLMPHCWLRERKKECRKEIKKNSAPTQKFTTKKKLCRR